MKKRCSVCKEKEDGVERCKVHSKAKMHCAACCELVLAKAKQKEKDEKLKQRLIAKAIADLKAGRY